MERYTEPMDFKGFIKKKGSTMYTPIVFIITVGIRSNLRYKIKK